MRRSIGLLATVVLLSACAPVLNTGTTKKNMYKDTRHDFSFTKADNWRYSIPWEKKTESVVRRFSIYYPQVQYSTGGKKVVPEYSRGRDPLTGHPIVHFRHTDGRRSVRRLATAHFSVDTTQMNMEQVNEELLEKYQDFKFAGRILLGELGEGYHLTQERNGYGDAYFTVKDGKLYLIDYISLKGQYMKFRLQLEKMLSTFSFVD